MSDALVATADHYQKVRARLWGGPAKKRAAIIRKAKQVELKPAVMDLPPMRKSEHILVSPLPKVQVQRPVIRDWLWVCSASAIKTRVGFSADAIILEVAQYFSVPPTQITAHSRSSIAVRARFAAVHLIFQYAGLNGPDAGKALSRDHSTLSWTRRRAAAMCRLDPVFAADVVAITNKLMGGRT